MAKLTKIEMSVTMAHICQIFHLGSESEIEAEADELVSLSCSCRQVRLKPFVDYGRLTPEWYQTFMDEGPGLEEPLTIRQLSPLECD